MTISTTDGTAATTPRLVGRGARARTLGILGLLGAAIATIAACGDDIPAAPPPSVFGPDASTDVPPPSIEDPPPPDTTTPTLGSSSDAAAQSSDAGTGADAACASETQAAKQLPLDLILMLDTSGSMTETTAGGATKWDAVKSALASFMGDPASAGLGVAVSYFPQDKPGVPAVCTTSAQCGAGAPCAMRACTNTSTLTYCTTNADCPGFPSQCTDLGTCSANAQLLCFGIGQSCGNGNGSCIKMTQATCSNALSCDATDYSTAAVAYGTLPGASAAVSASLAARTPDGWTPTFAALTGAMSQAKTVAVANPTHTVATLLMTDGLPTECAPTDIPTIAAVAANGAAQAPAVNTFVVGVFAPSEQATAQSNLDALAAAGGTKQAFIINTGQNVATSLLAVLNSIRTSALPCEYEVPAPKAGSTPSYDLVNVLFTPGGGGAPETIVNVGSAGACDAKSGGWYYDGDPRKIVACPATCSQFKADAAGKVDIALGCKTVIK